MSVHLNNIKGKLGAESRVGIVTAAMGRGLIESRTRLAARSAREGTPGPGARSRLSGADQPDWARRSIRRTNVVRTSNGELLVSFRRCAGDDSPDGHPVVFASADEVEPGKNGSVAADGAPSTASTARS